ncbi:hypothetical protein AURDEDRAFT_136832 [Auricularia subglabra TFB-10046 SS5]|nr:hypothetical protein AURDEDRAFT_136832 [Auricularia subglabra TFB-10046 SS5]
MLFSRLRRAHSLCSSTFSSAFGAHRSLTLVLAPHQAPASLAVSAPALPRSFSRLRRAMDLVVRGIRKSGFSPSAGASSIFLLPAARHHKYMSCSSSPPLTAPRSVSMLDFSPACGAHT